MARKSPVDWQSGDYEVVDRTCPECEHEGAVRSTTFTLEELRKKDAATSLSCEECEHGWMEDA